MKPEHLLLALICACVIFSGCCITPPQPPTGGSPTPEITPTETPLENETPEMAPFSASEGRTAAAGGITWLRGDAQLVGVQGACGGDGKAPQWDYHFDSVAAGRGYVVSVPGGAASMRDATFSFSQPLGGQWVDSTQAASACRMSDSDCSIEMRDGTPVWTFISGATVCEVNATSGQRMEGG